MRDVNDVDRDRLFDYIHDLNRFYSALRREAEPDGVVRPAQLIVTLAG